MEKPELGSGTVLTRWEREGRQLSKWELCRVIKELRKYKRYDRALEVITKKWVLFFIFAFLEAVWIVGWSWSSEDTCWKCISG